jgi:hypothetical protein
MKKRCYIPSSTGFANYGGRGITVCERWRDSFEAFFADMGPRPSPKHSLERINNGGHYEPGNCRWATKLQQSENRRTNRLFTHNGRTQTISQWSRETGINYYRLHTRLCVLKWSPERALHI